jgi:hypothetical protein
LENSNLEENSKEEVKKMSVNQMINSYVIPKWCEYIASKTERREADPTKKPRLDTFRKKVLRDMREFYRIMFRKRFHLSEYKTYEGVQQCLQTFFSEIGISPSEEDFDDFQLFRYLHQTHVYTSMKVLKRRSPQNNSPFKVIEKYNDYNFRRFLKHPLCAKMFYFVFHNYLQHYTPLIKPEYKTRVMEIVSMLLN